METLIEDHRTDLYSVGVMFWTLLVGRGTMPFEGGPLELLHAIVQKRPMPVHEVRRDIPQVLALIIDKVSMTSFPPLDFVETDPSRRIAPREEPGHEVPKRLWPQGRPIAMPKAASPCRDCRLGPVDGGRLGLSTGKSSEANRSLAHSILRHCNR